MADPLSVSASIAGLVTLVDIVYLRLTKYIKSVKNAEKEIADLCKEVNMLGGAVSMLSRLARGFETENEPPIVSFRMHHIEGCSRILTEISNKMKKLEEGPRSKIKRLIWPFTSATTKEMIAELSRHKQNVNLALSAQSMDILLRCLAKEEDRQRSIAEVMADVQKTREIVVRISVDSRRQKILDFFLGYNPQPNFEMSIKLRHPRTGLWLEALPSFQNWLLNPGSRMWLTGIPGAGKTVLAGSIIENALARSSETVATGFFFCDYKNQKTQNTVNVLAGLAHQLARQNGKAFVALEEYYTELHPEKGLPRTPSPEDLERIIVRMADISDQTYLVIDGLDECGDNVEQILSALCSIAENSERISMLILSRDEQNIRERLIEPDGSFFNLKIAAHTEDITEYVTAEIEKRIGNKKLHFEDISLKAEILEGLVSGANGMFRWVSCQLDHLADCMSDDECREALRSLPPDLPETYLRILKRVPKAQQHHVQLTLNFIAFAEPRLTVAQLREILSLPSNGTFLRASGLIREDAISRHCSSLVRTSNDGDYLEFAHFSVQEFLISDDLETCEFGMFNISKRRCNRILAQRCAEYLMLSNFNHMPTATEEQFFYINERSLANPLYDYAAINWLRHAREQWDDPGLLNTAKRLFSPVKTAQFTTWAVTLVLHLRSGRYNLPEKYTLITEMADHSMTTLHFAATLSLPEITSFLLQESGLEKRKCTLGSPLQCAINCLYGSLRLREDNELWEVPRYARTYIGTPISPNHFTLQTIRIILNHGTECSESAIMDAINTWIQRSDFSVLHLLIAGGIDIKQQDLDALSVAMDEDLEFLLWKHNPEYIWTLGWLCEHLSSRIDELSILLDFC
ncbi:uncharacterized protein LY79DRAFT_527521 [Colletotrichum navitas]|uniref:NACHT domain-containing protein n=1 Tax=Colletotrichum navitas TaxID=681940 RepID=A0AAD8UZS5_9PEZI|nr:uncharacterized protein LY79DRAFT_527521 [Colletotrichum navitas]KAK1570094.1 hypothetical protein LY79DRAFT_527521 [Colletotrichum navitas]